MLNPAYLCLVNSQLNLYFYNRTSNIRPLILRARDTLADLSLPIQPVLPYRTPSIYSWMLRRPKVDTSLATPFTKTTVNFHLIFREYVYTEYQGYSQLYTDGSKNDNGVGAAAVFGLVRRRATHALMVVCNLIADHQRDDSKYLECTDSLSVAQGLLSVDQRNHFMHRVQVRLHHLLTRGIVIVVLWTPSHMGIPGNELADQAAKSASSGVPEFICCPYTDWTPYIKRAIYARWEERWNFGDRHLLRIRSSLGGWRKLQVTRREGVIINRLRISHSNLTRGYIMEPVHQSPSPYPSATRRP